MAHLFVIANSIIIIIVTTFFVYSIGGAIFLGQWHQLLLTGVVLFVLIIVQMILAIIAES